MKNSKVSLSDHLTAGVLSAASSITHRFPGLEHALMKPDVVKFVPVRWHRLPLSATDLDWVSADGHGKSGRLPKKYLRSAVISADVWSSDCSMSQSPLRPAVAYRLGSAVVVGVLDNENTFGVAPDDPNRDVVAMGIGKGVLDAAMGLWTPDREFIPASDVRMDGTYPNQELPAYIPRV